MANRKLKKDFDKEKMYAKIMPSVFAEPPSVSDEPEEAAERPAEAPPAPQPRYILRNYVEDIVLEKYAHTMKMLKACCCEKCVKDVMAIALNELPPVYLAVAPDAVDQTVLELRGQLEIKVSTALIQAVQQIKSSPNH